MDILAKIKGIEYKPFLCKELDELDIHKFSEDFQKNSSFILRINNDKLAVSWWVSPKRTRSYPYARIYNTLDFLGKKITIVPVFKDEGKDGDRDFLQWDTISLMSLLGIYTIISYYIQAVPNKKYKNKITNQKFDTYHIKRELEKLLTYQSDALHWNMSQIEKIGTLSNKALESYDKISLETSVEMHSKKSAEKKIDILLKSKEEFMNSSRNLAKKAQLREIITVQPKEYLIGKKATLTIENYLGGFYYFTTDEIEILEKENKIYLIEGKHLRNSYLPSIDDIKDGLFKMVLFVNLKEVLINGKEYRPIPVLKLTSSKYNKFSLDYLNSKQKNIVKLLEKEAKENKFKLIFKDSIISS